MVLSKLHEKNLNSFKKLEQYYQQLYTSIHNFYADKLDFKQTLYYKSQSSKLRYGLAGKVDNFRYIQKPLTIKHISYLSSIPSSSDINSLNKILDLDSSLQIDNNDVNSNISKPLDFFDYLNYNLVPINNETSVRSKFLTDIYHSLYNPKLSYYAGKNKDFFLLTEKALMLNIVNKLNQSSNNHIVDPNIIITIDNIRNNLLISNVGLVHSIINSIRKGSNLYHEDLLAPAYEGLLKAIDNFDYNRNNKLSTFATYWIKSRVNSFKYNTKSIKIPYSVLANNKPLITGKNTLTPKDIALLNTINITSLDSVISESDPNSKTYYDLIPNNNISPPGTNLIKQEEITAIDKLTNNLGTLDKVILNLYVGIPFNEDSINLNKDGLNKISKNFNGSINDLQTLLININEPITNLAKIARILGVTREYIRQRKKRMSNLSFFDHLKEGVY